jgi:hypothetical protein
MVFPMLIELPKILDERGNLTFLQSQDQVPFEIKRTYWVYDVPGGEERGSHAFRNTEELIIALSGSFDVVLHDGSVESVFSLNRSYHGLIVAPMIWRTLRNFSTNALALILASTEYSSSDYIRDFAEFCNTK